MKKGNSTYDLRRIFAIASKVLRTIHIFMPIGNIQYFFNGIPWSFRFVRILAIFQLIAIPTSKIASTTLFKLVGCECFYFLISVTFFFFWFSIIKFPTIILLIFTATKIQSRHWEWKWMWKFKLICFSNPSWVIALSDDNVSLGSILLNLLGRLSLSNSIWYSLRVWDFGRDFQMNWMYQNIWLDGCLLRVIRLNWWHVSWVAMMLIGPGQVSALKIVVIPCEKSERPTSKLHTFAKSKRPNYNKQNLCFKANGLGNLRQ